MMIATSPLQDRGQSRGDLMIDLGELSRSTGWEGRRSGFNLRCSKAGLLEHPGVGSGQDGQGGRPRAPLPSLYSQDSLLSQQTILTHMCEELI